MSPPPLPSRTRDLPIRCITKNKCSCRTEELLTLSASRRAQLEDAIKLYSFFAECDDFDKWVKDKEKMLRTDDAEDSVDTAKRKYEVRR